jgi:hypothetical protein
MESMDGVQDSHSEVADQDRGDVVGEEMNTAELSDEGDSDILTPPSDVPTREQDEAAASVATQGDLERLESQIRELRATLQATEQGPLDAGFEPVFVLPASPPTTTPFTTQVPASMMTPPEPDASDASTGAKIDAAAASGVGGKGETTEAALEYELNRPVIKELTRPSDTSNNAHIDGHHIHTGHNETSSSGGNSQYSHPLFPEPSTPATSISPASTPTFPLSPNHRYAHRLCSSLGVPSVLAIYDRFTSDPLLIVAIFTHLSVV